LHYLLKQTLHKDTPKTSKSTDITAITFSITFPSGRRNRYYRDTPRFQGIKYTTISRPAWGMNSPHDAFIQYSSISSPISSMGLSPEIIGPQSISMISLILLVKAVLEETLITGHIGFPVGVPRPVVNKISVAPLAALPVVASTSLPGVHTRFKPDLNAGSV